MWDSVREYAERTRESVYTLVLVLPFLAVYEIGIVALRITREQFRVRNGADAIIRSVLFPLGLQRAGTLGAIAWGAVSVLVLAACYAVWRARERAAPDRDRQDAQDTQSTQDDEGRASCPSRASPPSRPSLLSPAHFEVRYAGCLVAESAGWALLLLLASLVFFGGSAGSEGSRVAAGAGAPGIAAELVLNAGAGVYEELVFRVFLVLLLALFFTKILHFERVPGGIAAAVAAAVIFSLVHFGNGPGADAWGGPGFWPLFTFRAAAGLLFSLLFYFRSFGVAVAAHALYDNMVTAARALS